MAVSILWDPEQEVAAFYCTTSETAFEPIFRSRLDAQDFQAWVDRKARIEALSGSMSGRHFLVGGGDGTDLRDYTPFDLERIYVRWLREREEGPEPDGYRTDGGRIIPTSR